MWLRYYKTIQCRLIIHPEPECWLLFESTETLAWGLLHLVILAWSSFLSWSQSWAVHPAHVLVWPVEEPWMITVYRTNIFHRTWQASCNKRGCSEPGHSTAGGAHSLAHSQQLHLPPAFEGLHFQTGCTWRGQYLWLHWLYRVCKPVHKHHLALSGSSVR